MLCEFLCMWVSRSLNRCLAQSKPISHKGTSVIPSICDSLLLKNVSVEELTFIRLMHKYKIQFLALDFLLLWFIMQHKWEIEHTHISYLDVDTEVCDVWLMKNENQVYYLMVMNKALQMHYNLPSNCPHH